MLLDIHATWAWVVIVGNGLAGIWTLFAWKKPALRTKSLWWFVIFAEAAIFLQVILGVIMVSAQDKHPAKFHMFYGFVALISVTLLYSYRAQLKRYLYPLYGFGSLFLMGLGIRAMLVVHG